MAITLARSTSVSEVGGGRMANSWNE